MDSIEQSLDRVAIRGTQQNGIIISGSNVTINFNASFKNIASYYFYFDKSDFIYTESGGKNQKIMSFKKNTLLTYQANKLQYPQRFAQFAFSNNRLSEETYNIITANQDYPRKVIQP